MQTHAVAFGLERLVESLRKLTPREGLSLTAVSTLKRLARSGPQRLAELHAAEGVTQPAMTQLVTRLEKEGLATRGSDPADGRAVLVAITDDGRALVEERRMAYADALSAVLVQLPAEDHAAIVAALPAMEKLGDLIAAPQS